MTMSQIAGTGAGKPVGNGNASPAHAPTDDEILGIDIGATATKRMQHRGAPSHETAQGTEKGGSQPPRLARTSGIFARQSQIELPLDGRAVATDENEGAARNVAGARSAAVQAASEAENGEKPGAPSVVAEVPEELKEIFEMNPELRQAWQAEKEFRGIFPTVEDARAAQAQVADFAQLDAWFFSGQPDTHAELAGAVYRLNPAAFRSLAQAMAETLAHLDGKTGAESQRQGAEKRGVFPSEARDLSTGSPSAPTEQRDSSRQQVGPQNETAPGPQANTQFATFYQETNAGVVEGAVDAIRGQVERLLPEGIAPGAQNRVVGEIYRELDASLRGNHALATQVRQAFRSGAMDADHQTAVVALILGRAKQALPAVAKRVINEWTSGVLAASDQKLARQRAAEGRVDITGGAPGNAFKRPLTPKDVDYAKLSDGDILNL